MKALQYNLETAEYDLNVVGYWTARIIKEIFIPEINIAINDDGNIIETNKSRNPANIKTEEIEIDNEFANALALFIKTKNSIKRSIIDYFENKT